MLYYNHKIKHNMLENKKMKVWKPNFAVNIYKTFTAYIQSHVFIRKS